MRLLKKRRKTGCADDRATLRFLHSPAPDPSGQMTVAWSPLDWDNRCTMSEESAPNVAKPLHKRDPYGLLALSIYLTISILVFGRPLLGHFRDRYIGTGPDPTISM